jgi:hypothetical protein
MEREIVMYKELETELDQLKVQNAELQRQFLVLTEQNENENSASFQSQITALEENLILAADNQTTLNTTNTNLTL